MIDFLKRLFGHTGSSSTAKERLRLVLMTDHLELAPEMIDSMKRDLVDVISRYVEVDRDKIEVNFEQQDRALAMLANIPILSVNRPKSNGEAKSETHDEEPAAVAVAVTPTPEQPESETPSAETPTATEATQPEPVANGAAAHAATESIPSRRRRKRKRTAVTTTPAAASS